MLQPELQTLWITSCTQPPPAPSASVTQDWILARSPGVHLTAGAGGEGIRGRDRFGFGLAPPADAADRSGRLIAARLHLRLTVALWSLPYG